MFGMAVGALMVYLRPRCSRPTGPRASWRRARCCFAVPIVAASWRTCGSRSAPSCRSRARRRRRPTPSSSVPFTFSGIVRRARADAVPAQVSALYAADLAGAAVGCALLAPLLDVTDGPTADRRGAAIAGVGAALFACDRSGCAAARRAHLACRCARRFAAATPARPPARRLLRLVWVKGLTRRRPIYERWNSFSRIRVVATRHERQALRLGVQPPLPPT